MRGLLLALVLVGPALAGCVEEGPDRDAAVERAIAYLVGHQNLDGGFPIQAGGVSDFGTSAWIALAMGAGAQHGEPADRLVGYLTARADDVRTNATGSFSVVNAVALLVLAAQALDAAPAMYQGTDPVSRLKVEAQNESLGANEKVFVLGALRRAGEGAGTGALVEAVRADLAGPRDAWPANDAWFRSNALLALLAAPDGISDTDARDEMRALLEFQVEDAGFAGSADRAPDASTTASVLAVLHQVGFVYSHEKDTAATFLMGLQQPDGSVRFSEADDFAREKTTAEAILGWTGKGPFRG